MHEAVNISTRVLLIEDNQEDYELTRVLLRDVAQTCYELVWVKDFDHGLRELTSVNYDVCLLGNQRRSRSYIDLLKTGNAENVTVPIIMMTGSADRDLDQAAMEAGASDFLVRSDLTPELIERTIRYTCERHRLRYELEHLAKYDPLTGLANRTLFQDFLQGAISRSNRGGRPLALLFLDLDHFKHINDTFGHLVGDGLLCEVGTRLKSCVRGGDLVARLGGDEFAIVLDDIGDPTNAATVARKVLRAIEVLYYIDGNELRCFASIGIAINNGGFKDATELIKSADTAMYDAKRHGRNNFRFFVPSMQKSAFIEAQMQSTLANDIANNKLQVHYQAQVDATSGSVTGIEALARWRGYSPAQFIPLAEQSGLIVPLGEAVLRQACRDFSKWRQQGLINQSTRLSVNVSAVQLQGDSLVKAVQSALRQSDLPATALELELTETAIMSDSNTAVAILEELDRLSVRIVTDDFGTGYSSLANLIRYPIQALKVDASFVRGIGLDRQSETIIKATIALTESLRLDIIAEGVETRAQAEFLLTNGCRVMQGWLYNRAADAKSTAESLVKLGEVVNGLKLSTLDLPIHNSTSTIIASASNGK